MGGLVIDVFIAFIVRAVILLLRKAESRNWPVIAATVRASSYERPGFGCDYAEIRYQYKTSGERYQGVLRKPFLFRNYGEAYVCRFAAGCEVQVRMNPKDATDSVLVRA